MKSGGGAGDRTAAVPAPRQATPSPNWTVAQWLTWQESLHVRDIDLGLERCRRVAARMGLLTPAYTVLTVAGTNGKGSVVAMLSAILRHAGHRVATYTSPHLRCYNERIQVDEEMASDAELCAAFVNIEHARQGESLTYFEFGTLAALQIFRAKKPDFAILEVGLGGRLDAVNIVDPTVAVITAIGIDHVEWLGHSRDEIALEKGGIMRNGRPAICADHEVPGSLLDAAEAIAADLRVLGRHFHFVAQESSWTWWSGDEVRAELPHPNLHGDYQLRNAAGALAAIAALQPGIVVSQDAVQAGLCSVTLAGRFHRLRRDFEYVLDVAHNAQAMGEFVATLRTLPNVARTFVLVGMLRTKDRVSAVRILAPITDEWHLATLPTWQGGTSEELRALIAAERLGGAVHCYDSVAAALATLQRIAGERDRVVIIGSFLTVGAALDCLESPGDVAGDGNP